MHKFNNRSASPLPEPITQSSSRRKSTSSRYELSRLVKLLNYIRRLFRYDHMDFEYAFWQQLNLFLSPSKVIRNQYYRKQTKNRYSRDDPAFLVLLSIWFLISASCLSFTLNLQFLSFIKFLFFVIFIDCIAVGLIVATLIWFISNRFMINKSWVTTFNDQVEWAYSFDIHLNAFFPPLVIIHCFQIIVYSSKYNIFNSLMYIV